MMKSVRRLAGLASLAGVLLAGAASAATVVGAHSVHVTSANNTWIQISELQAFDFSNVNVALAANGGVATAPNLYHPLSVPANANDGVFPQAFPFIYHSGTGGSTDFLNITFAGAHTLASLTIYGEGDPACCSFRDIFNIDIRDAAGKSLYAGTLDAFNASHSASVSFTRPPGGAVPEPASWAMMILGFGLAGATIRSRRRALA